MSTGTDPDVRVPRAAVFLDRDGILVDDVPLTIDPGGATLRPGVPDALHMMADNGYLLIVISNQTVVARGLATEVNVAAVNSRIAKLIVEAGGPKLDAWYFCPHHPNADIVEYRMDCDCRKPRPGLLRRAASELSVDLAASFMIGDRGSDVAAGRSADCRTALVLGSRSYDPPIESPSPWQAPDPDFSCSTLLEAAHWILAVGRA